jgi:hypothetical protein
MVCVSTSLARIIGRYRAGEADGFSEFVGFVEDNSPFVHTIRLLLEQLDGAA